MLPSARLDGKESSQNGLLENDGTHENDALKVNVQENGFEDNNGLSSVSKRDEELEIIQRQLRFPQIESSFFTLFRYATAGDFMIIFISTICALAAGSILPIPPIIYGRLASFFAGIENGGAVNGDSNHRVSYYSMFFVYIAIGGLVVWFVSVAGFTYTGSKITRQIKVRYMEALLRQNMAIFDDIGTGQLVAQLGADLNVIQEALSQKLSLTISSMGTLIATYAISFALYWKLTFILTWSFFLSLGLLYIGNKIAVRYSGRSMEAQSSGSSIVEEALGSIRSTTALGLQKYIANSYDKYLDVGEKAGVTLKTLMGTMIAVTVGTGYLNVSLAFWQGSRFLVEGETSFMDIVAIALITKSAAYCVLGVGQNAETFTTAVAAGRRVFRMISRVSTIDSMSDHGTILEDVEGNVEFRNIKHIYPSRPGVVVANNLNILFPSGKTTAIVGASGSGKSSITKLIMRFYEPVNGDIFLDGHNLQELNLKWLRRQIRLVNQEPYLFDTTIFENIEFGFVGTQFENMPTEEKKRRVEQAAKIACAHDFVTALPQGYQTTVGAKGSKLSGGQKQRIAIARALVAEPKILVLDEATSALDTKTEASVQAALNASSESRTTITVAHRLSTVREADNIVVMKAGMIVEQGTHRELLERKGQYFELVGAQKTVDDEGDEEKPDELAVEPVVTAKSEAKKEGVPNINTESQPFDIGQRSVRDKESSYSLLSMSKFVMGLNAKEWHYILLGLFCSVLAGFEEPVMAILYGKAVVAISRPLDHAKQIRSDAGFWAWMFFLLAVSMMLVFTMQGWVFAYCSERLIHRARQLALGQMLRQEIAFFDDKDNSSGALVSFLSTEAADLAGISGATLGMILIAISTLISGFVVGMVFGWKLALVCSSVIPILIASGIMGVWAAGEFEKLNEKYTRASASYAGEAISAIQTVASLTRESEVLQTYEETLTASSREGLKANLKVSLVLALAQSGVTACTALGFWYGGTLFIKGEYSLLQFVVVNSSIISSAYSAGLVFSFTPNIGKAKRSVNGLLNLLERQSSIDPESKEGRNPGRPQGKVDFRNVNFAYPTRPQHPALQNISFSIPAGSSIAFVGHTGCGKSTIVSLLERFYDPSSGAIFLDENPIAGLNITEYRRCIGLVNQEPTMLRGSIKMNLLAGNEEENITDEAIEEACKQANIYDFIRSLPDGINTTVGNRGDQLSGGQKQRLALARALVRNPAILVLDEATSAVDSQSEALIQDALEKATKGRTTITIAHRLSTIRNSDVIYVLDKGRLLEFGSHTELMARKGRYYELFNTARIEE